MPKQVLLTGGAGFAGAHIAEHILHQTDWTVVVLDRLNYAGSLERLRDTIRDFPERLKFVYHDFRSAFPAPVLQYLEGTNYVIHNGGETHVERSLTDPEPFVMSNVLGTMNVLDACRKLNVEHVIQVSTDEVHGPAPDGVDFKEDAEIRPSNPYSATKAGAEALAYAYYKAYRLPVTITRTMNLFGERQHPEKFVPMTIRKVLHGEKVTLHGSNQNPGQPGRVSSRKWLHARNQADALLFLLRFPKPGQHWAQRHEPTVVEQDGVLRTATKSEWIDPARNILGETFHIAGVEKTVLQIADFVAQTLEKELDAQIIDFHSQRPGHDLRYSLDDSKIRGLGWNPPVSFEDSMRRTIEWTVKPENRRWLAE